MEAVAAETGVVTCPFDHHTVEYGQQFRDILDDVRAAGPLVWTEAHGGYWIASSWAMVRRLAIDSERFTVTRAPGRPAGLLIPAPPGAETRPRFVPVEADGAEHDVYRLALNPHFSKQRVSELTPMVERHVSLVLDRIIARGDFDVAHDLVAPILSGIACEHLGLEVDEPAPFFDALMSMVQHMTPEEYETVKATFDAAWELIVATVDERRAAPRDDVISHLVRWETPIFTDEEIHMMVLNVSLGANDTTKSLLAQALLFLDTHPDVRAMFTANPDLIRGSIDEFLRLIPVAMGNGRTATCDVEIDGVQIREGQRVLLSYSGANHDPAKYAHPREFDLERGGAQHLGMGVGTHFCLGAWLAKSISATTMRELLRRTPNFSIDHDKVVINPIKSSLVILEAVPAHVGLLPSSVG